ncbi:MAG TPA: PQQ-binding-like beta-propeller repeat protein [Bryobacteraceae bacterium]|nr:PQQ-binding-like beta-propeller repeat protein [Bryobacteraceae bacterium]
MPKQLLRHLFVLASASLSLAAEPCPPAPNQASGASWNGWADAANTRFQNAKSAGLTAQTTPNLKLKWAFGFPNVTTAFGAPTVFAGRVYVGAADGVVYSLDARTGCTEWTFTAASGVRVAPVLDNNGKSVYFGDLKANIYALDAQSGHQIWKTLADDQSGAVITGSPKLDSGRLYIPVSGRDESMAATNPAYECCKFRGNIVALDTATGKRIWQTFTIAENSKPTGQNAKGAKTWGPSGAVPWSSPTLDLQKKVLYTGTGVNYSKPPTATSDAILAIDMNSGRLLWSRQFTADDSWNFACGPTADKTNCPKLPFIDADLGNSGTLRSLPGGKRILVTSDKGGTVWAIDPDHEGAIVWKQKIAAGGVNGGTMWGGASDERAAYIGISDFAAGKPEVGGGLVALQLATGEKLWQTPAPKPACLGKPNCSSAQPAPVSAIPGVVFLGSWDGHIRAYEAAAGKIIWDFDTLQDFPTVNGVKAHGGSINSVGPAIAGSMLYVTSGYSGNGMQGNVLLAFSIDGK